MLLAKSFRVDMKQWFNFDRFPVLSFVPVLFWAGAQRFLISDLIKCCSSFGVTLNLLVDDVKVDVAPDCSLPAFVDLQEFVDVVHNRCS